MDTFTVLPLKIIVSGGNTLFAVDRWESCGLNGLLCDAMMRGAVLCGGSCGAMCWFDSGHSDSNDPSSFQHAMLHEASTNGDATSHGVNSATEADAADESSSAPSDGATSAAWDYIRVPCLGFLPGLCCPHFDKVQSNGVLRAVDVEGMALRHPGERVVCIDHHAALVCEGGGVYSVFRLPAAQGSVRSDGSFAADRSGEPGVWIKDVVHGAGDRDGQSRVSAPLHVIGALVGHRH
eukprot:m.999207 g.999207  ORF g.999207 m.999207 type:complete len:236 (+) comp24026_c0_seq25:681-1388(+)